MKTLLVLALIAVSLYAFGPSLFTGELRIFGTRQEAPAPSPVRVSAPEPVAPAVYGPDGASPIFPEPKTRPEPRKAQETPKTARNWRPAPSPSNCYGPVCYYPPGE